MAVEPKLTLREFQARLADRLKSAGQQGTVASMIGFIAGGRNWLVDLRQINEIVTIPSLTPVPWSKSWFSGVASVRGAIYGTTDLAAYFGMAPPMDVEDYRLLLTHPRYGVNAALRITQPLGLRSTSGMKAIDAPLVNEPAIACGWLDRDGIEWIGLDIEKLLNTPKFLQAGA